MKRIVLTLSLAFIAASGFGQMINVTKAALAYMDFEESLRTQDIEKAVKEIKEAKEYIDMAVNVETKTKDEAKRQMYIGKIYIGVAFGYGMDSTAFEGVDIEKTMEDGFAALKQSKKVDDRERYVDEINEYANIYRSNMANLGITAYGEEKYAEAMAGLLGAAKFGDVIGIADSMYYFFGGQAALIEKEYEVAEEAFKECIALNYNTGESVGFLTTAMKEQGKNAEAEKALADAVAKYPDNLEVLKSSILYFVSEDRNEEASESLEAALAISPDNVALVYMSGIIYEDMAQMDDAEAAYKKTLALDPKHTDAKYSLGVFYFNKGADANNEANKLDFNDPQYDAKHEAKIEESKGFFALAVEQLKKAEAETPDDVQVLEALKMAYGKAGMVDEFKATKAKIEALKG